MTTFEDIQIMLGQGICRADRLMSWTEFDVYADSPSSKNTIVLIAGQDLTLEFIDKYPLQENHVAGPATDAVKGPLSTYHGISMVTDMYAHPTQRYTQGIWVISFTPQFLSSV